MKLQDFNNLMTFIQNQLEGFKITYKLYDKVYCFNNSDKSVSLEFRFEMSNLFGVQKHEISKDSKGSLIDSILVKDSLYKLTTIQSVKILTLLEGYCYD